MSSAPDAELLIPGAGTGSTQGGGPPAARADYALGVENQITEMVRRLGACPACGASWSVIEDNDGSVRIQGNRPAYAHEMRYDVPGAVRICSECGNGVDVTGKVVRRRE